MTLDDYEIQYQPRALPAAAEVGRIGPSPTGRPHIGTALQAVINRALASRTGGVFVLRIEDTDQARLVPGVVDEIRAELKWLDLQPDEGPGRGGDYGPYIQSERLAIYRAAVDRLIERGHAYRCFCTAERLEQVREEQRARGVTARYDGACRALTAADVADRLARGESHVVRMRIPEDEPVTFEDLARGAITIQTTEVDDAVILKSDGFPTYHLAVVVDDHFMRVTTVIRGEEWISSAPKHVLLYRYFGWTAPRFLHTALLRDAKGRKLSKRSGDTSIAYYRQQGIVAEAFRNFLTRIIWAHPEEKDVYDFGEFVSHFELQQLSVAGPVVDPALLTHINSEYLRQLTPEQLYERVLGHLQSLAAAGNGFVDDFEGGSGVTIGQADLETFASALAQDRAKGVAILSHEPERYKRLTDVLIQGRFYYAEFYQPPSGDQIVAQLGGAERAREFFTEMIAHHDRLVESKTAWDGWIRGYATRVGLKAGKPFMALRLAITGTQMSPPLFEILQILGNDEVRRRLSVVLRALV